MHKRLAQIVFASLAILLIGPWTGRVRGSDSPSQLKLFVLPSKTAYAVDEKASVKYRLTNVSASALCFPKPNLECHNTRSGSVMTKLDALASVDEREKFICYECGGGWGPSSKLPSLIRQKWIRLEPYQSYETELVELEPALRVPGNWRLEATYEAPQAAFGNAAEFKEYLQAGARKAGCLLPEKISSEPILLNVVQQSPH